jgi:DNA-directed RNA polymerase specialized sigma24 family protein
VVNDELFTNSLVARVVRSVSNGVGKQQRYIIPVEDLQQDAWLWVFQNSRKVSGWLEDDDSPSGKHARGMLSSSLRVHLHGICQKHRVERDGTLPGDYYFYTKAVVEAFLPDVFEPEAGTTMTAAAPRGTYVTSSKQPSEGFEYQAMLTDVRRGFQSLPAADKALLYDRFAHGGLEVGIMAASMDKPERTVRYQLSRAVNRIIRALGGEQPRRMREVKSNAAAVAQTQEQERGTSRAP